MSFLPDTLHSPFYFSRSEAGAYFCLPPFFLHFHPLFGGLPNSWKGRGWSRELYEKGHRALRLSSCCGWRPCLLALSAPEAAKWPIFLSPAHTASTVDCEWPLADGSSTDPNDLAVMTLRHHRRNSQQRLSVYLSDSRPGMCACSQTMPCFLFFSFTICLSVSQGKRERTKLYAYEKSVCVCMFVYCMSVCVCARV